MAVSIWDHRRHKTIVLMDVREHIRQDLQPYVCTYERCPDSDRMYASRHAWLEHERLVHRRIWRCFEHSSFISKSKDDLSQHFSGCHKGLDGQQIENLLDLAETTIADDRQTCPFCYSIGPFDKGFHNHVAFHQEQLATFAVPRNLDSNEETDSGRAQGIRSAGSLRSVALDFSDGDSSLDSDDKNLPVDNVDARLLDAARFGHEEVVKLLLEMGKIDVDSRDSSGRTPLSWAAENGHDAVIKLLFDMGKVDPDSKGSSDRTPLSWAAAKGHEAVVKLLLEKGAELETKAASGRTPLLWAAEYGHEAVVKLLLEKGAELETKTASGQTPLSWAAENGHEAVVKLLLEKGAALETKAASGRTPLSWAAEKGHEAVVKLLLEKGAQLETKDKEYGQTPLSWAAENGHEAVVKLLLEKGAELETKAASGRTPLSWAAEYGHEAVVKLLLEKGAKKRSDS